MDPQAASGARFVVDEALSPWRLFFSFDGRIARGTWWIWGVGALLGLGLIGFALLGIAGISARTAEAVVDLLLLWPMLAIWAKRWHDRGKSGWWSLVVLVPVVGWLWALIECGFLRGNPGPNRFGKQAL